MAEDIKVTFIIPKDCRNESDCSEDMQLAFTTCEQHCSSGLKAEWVHEAQWKKFDGLTKRDVFVLTEFEGQIYDKLRGTRCLLLGPRCLSCCLTEGVPIPSGPEPVFTVAMRGLVVTASGLSKQQKEKIKKKVHWMGGIYNNVLTDDTTHLVSDTVLSDKYIKSVATGIPVMSESWVNAVWEKSLHLNISGSSPDFDVHRLPPFANLQVTTSGISKKDKQMIMKLVNEYGGTFSGAFQSEATDVVVLTKEGVGSEKYKAALEYGKACVLPSWVKDSAAKGVALPMSEYRVAGASTSSPLAEHRLPDMSLNFSRITNLKPPRNYIDESKAVDMTTLSGKMKLSQDSKRSSGGGNMDGDIQEAFETLDMSSIKKAGPIFDGFCIWLTGLEGVARDRASACVSRAGGIRYSCPHARVTHVICGNRASAVSAEKALPNVPVLSARWLVKSVEAGRALDEAEFIIDTQPCTPAKSTARLDPASPMSKRNLQLLRHTPLNLPPPPARTPDKESDEIVNHYLSQNMPEEAEKVRSPEAVSKNATNASERIICQPDITDDMLEEPTEEIEQIFRGMKIEVQGMADEAICELGAEISAAGGVLVAAGAGGNKVLVPLEFFDDLITKDAEAVTVFWLRDCLSQQELVPIQYYHRPVKIPTLCSPGPLHGVVACLSTYSGMERVFLDELAKLLGATTQLRFCRRNTANSLASTHLICPTPVGDKYLGAVKWGLPAVTADWLLKCAQTCRRERESGYLVGETKAPPSPEQPNEQADIQANEQAVTATDKENAMLPPSKAAVPRRASLPSADNTPKTKPHHAVAVDDDMSPASRYIAMARQGLLGGDSQETPKRVQNLKDDHRQESESVRTPPLDDALSTPNLIGLSPTTRRRIQAVRRGEMPSDPIRTPNDPFNTSVETPDSCFGAALRPGSGKLSPDARKRLWHVVNTLPEKEPHPNITKHTPLSEIRNRFLAQFNGDAPTPPSDHYVAPRKLFLQEQEDTPPSKIAKMSLNQSAGSVNKSSESKPNDIDNTKSGTSSVTPAVDAQLQRLSAALAHRISSQKARRQTSETAHLHAPESEAGPESQPNTVGWDDTTPSHQVLEPALEVSSTIKRFMLSSNVDNREEIIEMIQHLGGEVCEGTEMDPEATHLLCAAPGRSEKMLGSIAAGRWVLHPAYVARSRAAGGFLNEEEYEWGNPLATSLPAVTGAERPLARAAHRWRVARRGGGGRAAGPFAGVVALLHVPAARRRLLSRLVVAGDGLAPDDEPPYSNEDITVCFADVKRYPLAPRDVTWLGSRGIPVCAPVLLSSYLTEEVPPDPRDHAIKL